jgi:hypothetical protein
VVKIGAGRAAGVGGGGATASPASRLMVAVAARPPNQVRV